MKTVISLSGGMDSATLAYKLKDEGHDLLCISIDYGQRHRYELDCARRLAHVLGGGWRPIDLSSINTAIQGSALTTTSMEMPTGHYTDESMKKTVVPGRNAMLISVAWAIAVSNHADFVALGAHAGDHPIYPDCRRPFIEAMQAALSLGTEGHAKPNLALIAPFLESTKGEILTIGLGLDVPYYETWTCYDPKPGPGRPLACGKCGACVERLEAFYQNGAIDPLEYAETA